MYHLSIFFKKKEPDFSSGSLKKRSVFAANPLFLLGSFNLGLNIPLIYCSVNCILKKIKEKRPRY